MAKDGANRNGFYAKLFVGLSVLAAGGAGTVLVALTMGANEKEHDRYEAKHREFEAVHESHEERIRVVETSIAVQEVMFETIREDTREIKLMIRELDP